MRTQTAARSQQLNEQQMMRDMARSLGLTVIDQESERRENARKLDRYGVTPGLHVVLSVQKGNTGLTYYYCYQSKTLIREIAIMDAKREAREAGFKTLCTLDIADYLSQVPPHYLTDKINQPK
jgi:hypothetical protein